MTSNPRETGAKRLGLGLSNDGNNIRSQHVVPADLPVSRISCKETWSKLSEPQKHFIHHFSRASWSGSRICCSQVSEESPDILRMLLLMFSSADMLDLKRRCHLAAVTPWEWDSFTAYAACFLANKGNYLAFGDMKFIPGIPDKQLDIIVRICPLKDDKKRRVLDLWDKTRKKIYSLSSVERRLGMPPHGLSAYYSNNMSAWDVQLVSDWMMDSEREPWNTRVWKTSGHGDLPEYELRIASARSLPTKTYSYKNKGVIHVIYGDHKEDLKDVVIHLRNAIPYADSDHQREMLKCFIDYLETGSIESHKRSQILWLQQGEPAIEVNIGFVETYRDPQRCRAEFEGYVAVLNQSASKQFRPLRERAKDLLSALPWPKEFHAEEAQSTGFSCFQIFAFANGSIPAGVNLPNYEDVRVAHGSRNLCFLDVLGSKDNNFQTTFLDEDDARIVQRLRHEVSVVQVAFHELLGHGSGKLFIRNSEGGYNFPYGKVRHPITGELVSTCYKPGETWNSVFGDISSAFEECRAECVGLFFTTHPEAMEAVGYTGQEAEDLMYVNWLMMVRAGFMAIAVYSEDTDIWPQAHAQARFAILCTLLAASELDVQENAGEDEQHERERDFIKIHGCEYRKVIVRMNRNKIKTVGFPALRTLLMRLQVYRSTADVTGGREFFKLLTTVPKSLLEFKRKISRNRRSGPLFVQAHTSLTTNKEGESRVMLEEFSPTPVGIIESSLARFRDWISGG
ncbi:hypothetical protein R1sor_017196 [Riccia sorocarpa]|uniref:Dipeptidyl aminopeptidase III n=1 Tax=Riccia sorocarpa TaxID=122646 RepID=A0ABD3I7X6_9MARC